METRQYIVLKKKRLNSFYILKYEISQQFVGRILRQINVQRLRFCLIKLRKCLVGYLDSDLFLDYIWSFQLYPINILRGEVGVKLVVLSIMISPPNVNISPYQQYPQNTDHHLQLSSVLPLPKQETDNKGQKSHFIQLRATLVEMRNSIP